MAVNFSLLDYKPNFDVWARPITVIPQTGGSFFARGIYDTRGTVIQTEAGLAVESDQETILDVRDDEFYEIGREVPVQGDQIDIPQDGAITVGVGLYEVTDAAANGGGETTLVIRKVVTPSVVGPP